MMLFYNPGSYQQVIGVVVWCMFSWVAVLFPSLWRLASTLVLRPGLDVQAGLIPFYPCQGEGSGSAATIRA